MARPVKKKVEKNPSGDKTLKEKKTLGDMIRRGTAQPIQGMQGRERPLQAGRPKDRIGSDAPNGEEEIVLKKGEFDDQVIGRTMEACFVKLIGCPIVQTQVRVGMMGNQRMERDLRRNSQGKQGEEPGCQYRSYGAMVDQNSF
jgi:hypothetical protein